ncbi:MAG: hypothetical protein LH613_09255 [Chamaesiphon sp.]|nr:hypothetical protein [Chamaesiphon sp.]
MRSRSVDSRNSSASSGVRSSTTNPAAKFLRYSGLYQSFRASIRWIIISKYLAQFQQND